MSDFVKADDVFVNEHATSREEVLRFLSQQAEAKGISNNANATYEAFMAREGMGETGMTDGFAVPHAKDDSILNAGVLVFKNDTPLDWPSFDEKPIDVAIALFVPAGEAGTTHIQLLSKTAVLLMKDDFKALVHGTDDKQKIADAINAGIAE